MGNTIEVKVNGWFAPVYMIHRQGNCEDGMSIVMLIFGGLVSRIHPYEQQRYHTCDLCSRDTTIISISEKQTPKSNILTLCDLCNDHPASR